MRNIQIKYPVPIFCPVSCLFEHQCWISMNLFSQTFVSFIIETLGGAVFIPLCKVEKNVKSKI